MFATPHGAEDALVALAQIYEQGGIALADAAVVAKTAGGDTIVRQTHDLTPARGAVEGAWLGALVGVVFGGPLGGALAGAAGGALYGKLVDKGLDDNWVKQMAEWLDPGTSALLLLVNDPGLRADVLRELGRFDATVVATTFPDYVRQAIEESLGER
jgi:uncharacterized membrane protein